MHQINSLNRWLAFLGGGQLAGKIRSTLCNIYKAVFSASLSGEIDLRWTLWQMEKVLQYRQEYRVSRSLGKPSDLRTRLRLTCRAVYVTYDLEVSEFSLPLWLFL